MFDQTSMATFELLNFPLDEIIDDTFLDFDLPEELFVTPEPEQSSPLVPGVECTQHEHQPMIHNGPIDTTIEAANTLLVKESPARSVAHCTDKVDDQTSVERINFRSVVPLADPQCSLLPEPSFVLKNYNPYSKVITYAIDVTKYFEVPMKRVAPLLGVSYTTFYRRWKEATNGRTWPFRQLRQTNIRINALYIQLSNPNIPLEKKDREIVSKIDKLRTKRNRLRIPVTILMSYKITLQIKK